MVPEQVCVQVCTLEDMQWIHIHLRDADILELRLIHGNADVWHLEYTYSLAMSAWTVYLRGQPACVFGVSCLSPFSLVGVPWLLATDALPNMRMIFLRQCRHYMAKMHTLFPRLENYVHADNTVSCAWLRWMNFVLDEAMPYGKQGALFHRFHKEVSYK